MSEPVTPVRPVPPENTRFTKDQNFRTVYANWVQATFTPFDISLVIGDYFPPAGPEEGSNILDVTQKFRVVFSPLEAKLAIGIFLQAMRNYETQFGKIVVPEVMKPEYLSHPGRVETAEDSTEGV